MKLKIDDGKLYKKNIFVWEEINPYDIENITRRAGISFQVELKTGKKYRFNDWTSYCEMMDYVYDNQIPYEVETEASKLYTEKEINELLPTYKEIVYHEFQSYIQNKFGTDYDVEVLPVQYKSNISIEYILTKNGQRIPIDLMMDSTDCVIDNFIFFELAKIKPFTKEKFYTNSYDEFTENREILEDYVIDTCADIVIKN